MTPLPSLRSKAQNVIRENLPYLRSRFAFKLGHANFPFCINCLNTILYLPIVTNVTFLTFKYKVANMLRVAAFLNVFENYPGEYLGDFQYYLGKKCMFRDSRDLNWHFILINLIIYFYNCTFSDVLYLAVGYEPQRR